ncbi:MAG: exonuclease SbcCD subunit D C-terminal domain-containing protein [Bacteroidales bacterium]|nr:exonuclease SbcCD subunit D C-terminal domain-containing protein [Bacteroidales bacterium]
MKILHTSDWHLGHTLYGHDRTEEQIAMLEQMVGIVGREKPDVFLLCGDVYHTSQPSAAVQTMLTKALMRIRVANPAMAIIAIAGNHDSSSKHEIFREAWSELNVYTIGTIDAENIDNHIIEIKDKGFVVAVPYCFERNIPEGFHQQLLDAVTTRNTNNLPVIMVAHTTISGCDFSGNEKGTEYTVGGIDSVDLGKMGHGYDYLALGHIHRPQFVDKEKHVRYSGTPLAVSFDERFEHTVSLVEISARGQQPEVTKVPVSNPRNLVNLPANGAEPWDEALALLKRFPSDEQAYIRLNVEVEDVLPTDAFATAAALTTDKKCTLCHINAVRKAQQQTQTQRLTIEEFKEQKPIDIANRYATDKGIELDTDIRALFDDVVRLVENEN